MRRYFSGQPIFTTQINGILCYCVVTHYLPAIPAKLTGAWEDADPGADEEFEYMILDDRYIRAPWLSIQMDRADEERLCDEYLLAGMAFRNHIEEA